MFFTAKGQFKREKNDEILLYNNYNGARNNTGCR